MRATRADVLAPVFRLQRSAASAAGAAETPVAGFRPGGAVSLALFQAAQRSSTPASKQALHRPQHSWSARRRARTASPQKALPAPGRRRGLQQGACGARARAGGAPGAAGAPGGAQRWPSPCPAWWARPSGRACAPAWPRPRAPPPGPPPRRLPARARPLARTRQRHTAKVKEGEKSLRRARAASRAGSRWRSRASRSASACARLLMSSLVHAKCVNSSTCARPPRACQCQGPAAEERAWPDGTLAPFPLFAAVRLRSAVWEWEHAAHSQDHGSGTAFVLL